MHLISEQVSVKLIITLQGTFWWNGELIVSMTGYWLTCRMDCTVDTETGEIIGIKNIQSREIKIIVETESSDVDSLFQVTLPIDWNSLHAKIHRGTTMQGIRQFSMDCIQIHQPDPFIGTLLNLFTFEFSNLNIS